MTRVLAISDEVLGEGYRKMFGDLDVDLVVSCGDLPHDYLEDVMNELMVPLVWVPGNHDRTLPKNIDDRFEFAPVLAQPDPVYSCGIPADGRIVEVAGLRIAGLGGSPRYNNGPFQYTESQMRWRSLKLEIKARLAALRGRPVDLLIAHAPARGWGDDDDKAHRGFQSFRRLVRAIRPRFFVHGHIHPHGNKRPDLKAGVTTVINAVGYRLLEVEGR
ncbi:MAG: metallophosphoesterase [Actinobacteria bacterium]|nr:metallophosphoesterase [Actinomycetota bacterium]